MKEETISQLKKGEGKEKMEKYEKRKKTEKGGIFDREREWQKVSM